MFTNRFIAKLAVLTTLGACVLPVSVLAQNRTRFAGTYEAVDYAYGITSAPGPLTIQTGNSAAGTTSITVQFAYVTLGDGTKLFPLATNAPITVGTGANNTQETVTPSGVSNCNFDAGYGSCTLTATFANAHGMGEPIVSGTMGLVEAANAANGMGGGQVAVDAAWVKRGGTQAMIATAQASLPATVTLIDNRVGSAQVRTSVVTLTNAQILALFTTPIAVVPAQGAGTLINVIDAVFENANTGVAYAAGGALQLSYGAGVTNPATATVAATFLTSPTVKQVIKTVGALASTAASAVVNTAVNVTNATANFTTGTGTVRVIVHYTVDAGY